MYKKAIDHPLYFSPSEKRGIFLLLMICLILHLLPHAYTTWMMEPPKAEDTSLVNAFAASLQFEKVEDKAEQKLNAVQEMFRFNPNTLNEEGWQRLGVSAKSAASIRKYISKGGRFHQPEDLYKMYGLPRALVDTLILYVDIPQKPIIAERKFIHSPKQYPSKPIDINIADSAAFESLPGIGPVLARRIVLFREKLGGFYKVEQVGETFGLADSVFQKIRSRMEMGQYSLKKININKVTWEELKMHPYIGYKKATAMIAYRKEHGSFSEVDDIMKIVLFSEVDYHKLKPYLAIQ